MKDKPRKKITLHGYTIEPDYLIKKNNGNEIANPYIAMVVTSPAGRVCGVLSGDSKNSNSICERALRIAFKKIEAGNGGLPEITLRTDHGADWNSESMTRFLAERGISHKAFAWGMVSSQDEAIRHAKAGITAAHRLVTKSRDKSSGITKNHPGPLNNQPGDGNQAKVIKDRYTVDEFKALFGERMRTYQRKNRASSDEGSS